MNLDTGRLLGVAWDVAPRLPEPFVLAVMAAAADVTWLAHGSGVRRLEANLRRVRPELSARDLRRLSRRGMRSYLRYYAQTLTFGRLTPAQLDARVRASNDGWIRARQAAGESVVLALAHTGNWDLAGAWAARQMPPIATVAEKLEPEELFQAFLALREGFGVRIVPLGKGEGSSVFRTLVQIVHEGSVLLPLLADRDLSRHGIEVDLFGERARVAAGPAALVAGGAASLATASLSYERLTGERRRAAGTRWGVHIDFSDPIEVDPSSAGRERVVALTQAWVDQVAAGIAAHPQDWHMLQRVFVADLDPDRLSSVDGRAA
ncbi:MAG: phosphatidylinositol mannoside acyltransferase [Actinobacteria bacterium]|nr:phosphatidylinositol mannoside acyltransferase [Actinomycetota bacterium]MCG2797287.1 phosphatidylinositol mannoside acyltransferase [Cellulomonas sp.]